jgi:hypothetical protein
MEFSTKEEADAAYAKNPTDQETYAAFSRYYSRAYPGESEVGAVDPQLEKLFNEAGQSAQQPQSERPPTSQNDGEASLEQRAADAEVESILRQEWGSDFERDIEAVKDQALELFGGDRSALIDFIVANGIDINPQKQIEAIRFLKNMARGK